MKFTMPQLQRQLQEMKAKESSSYYEFLRNHTMSAGLYQLLAGEEDRQQPHTEDEIYVIVEGSASFLNGETVTQVAKGDVLFVAAHVVHRFFDITEDLTTLVIFAPAEYANRS